MWHKSRLSEQTQTAVTKQCGNQRQTLWCEKEALTCFLWISCCTEEIRLGRELSLQHYSPWIQYVSVTWHECQRIWWIFRFSSFEIRPLRHAKSLRVLSFLVTPLCCHVQQLCDFFILGKFDIKDLACMSFASGARERHRNFPKLPMLFCGWIFNRESSWDFWDLSL